MNITRLITNKQMYKIEMQWLIRNFTQCQDDNIDSDQFVQYIGGIAQHWQLQVTPYGGESRDEVSVFLKSCSSLAINCEFKYAIVNGEKTVKTSSRQSELTAAANSLYIRLFNRRALANVLDADGNLTLHLEISVTENRTVWPTAVPSLESCLENALKLEMGTDCTIKSGDGVEMRCNKFMLAVASPVLDAMFGDNGLQESIDSIVHMMEFDAAVIQALLHFVYTRTLPVVLKSEQALALVEVADKYRMPSLTCLCESALIELLDVDNIVDVLAASYLHDVNRLKVQALLFASKHILAILNKVEWQQLREKKPHTTTLILEDVFKLK